MTALAITILTLLLWIGIVALLVWFVIWALGQFGVPIPPRAVQIVWVLLAIVVVIYILKSGVLPSLP